MQNESTPAADAQAQQPVVVTIHNVIILDKSGSMSSIVKPAIDGVNETLTAIARTQEKEPNNKQRVTLIAFCGCERKVIFDDAPVGETRHITGRDYQPCCNTPLYDAVGEAITQLHQQITGKDNELASITIITDGYENSSREFTGTALKALIDAYKAEGWLFSYIGADHDVYGVAHGLNIDNALQFEKSAMGTGRMFSKLNRSRQSWSKKAFAFMQSRPEMSELEKMEKMREMNSDFFDDDDDNADGRQQQK